MQSKPGKAGRNRAAAALAVGAALSTGAVMLPSTASAATKGISGTLKIITWVNPPAVTALTKIDNEFMKKYPNVKVQLE
ncbi:MAG: hypothetical protein ACRDZX_01545, partial [Acidimicrobiales bacterium]